MTYMTSFIDEFEKIAMSPAGQALNLRSNAVSNIKRYGKNLGAGKAEYFRKASKGLSKRLADAEDAAVIRKSTPVQTRIAQKFGLMKTAMTGGWAKQLLTNAEKSGIKAKGGLSASGRLRRLMDKSVAGEESMLLNKRLSPGFQSRANFARQDISGKANSMLDSLGAARAKAKTAGEMQGYTRIGRKPISIEKMLSNESEVTGLPEDFAPAIEKAAGAMVKMARTRDLALLGSGAVAALLARQAKEDHKLGRMIRKQQQQQGQ